MRVIRSAPLSPLRNKRIAVVGYGSQGRAQALNMRDAGLTPFVALPPRSQSRALARRDRMKVMTTNNAVRAADVVFLLAPDHLHGVVFRSEIAPHLRHGQMIAFAHASSVHFQLVKPPDNIDVVLLAPMGPGRRLRELRGIREGVACFFAVHQDVSGKARRIGYALANAIGCLPAGVIETTFAEEAVGDLFGEQAVLCGGLSALLQAGVETLVHHGMKPANAYLECVYQIDLIVDLIKRDGVRGMFSQISPTAAYGAVKAGPRVVSTQSRRALELIYREVASGEFLRRWIREASNSRIRPRPKFARGFLAGEKEVLTMMRSRSRAPKVAPRSASPAKYRRKGAR